MSNIGVTIGSDYRHSMTLDGLWAITLMTNFIAMGMVESVANYRHGLKFTD